jgi:hypothetical protein
LKSATKMTRTASCSATITFTEHYYKSAKKTVPVFDTQTICHGAYVAYNGSFVYYNSDYGRWEDADYWYPDSDVSYNDCATQTSKQVKTGTKVVLVRGAEYAHVTKTSTVESKLTITGALDSKDKFAVSNN